MATGIGPRNAAQSGASVILVDGMNATRNDTKNVAKSTENTTNSEGNKFCSELILRIGECQ